MIVEPPSVIDQHVECFCVADGIHTEQGRKRLYFCGCCDGEGWCNGSCRTEDEPDYDVDPLPF